MKLTPQILPKSSLLSILIPSWNNLEPLRLCVESVKINSTFSHQIIVHVNDGSDGALECVRSQGITQTHSEDNVGICLAINQAASLAQHNSILYLNDDMYCCPQWDINLLGKAWQIGHDAFVLSGAMIEPIDSGNRCVCIFDFGHNSEKYKILRKFQSLKKSDWYGSTWLPTLVSKRLWHAVDGYGSEISPSMSGDIDFSMTMWAAGCRVFLGVGDSPVYHFMCKSTRRIVNNDGRKQFPRKWGLPSPLFERYFSPPGNYGHAIDSIRTRGHGRILAKAQPQHD